MRVRRGPILLVVLVIAAICSAAFLIYFLMSPGYAGHEPVRLLDQEDFLAQCLENLILTASEDSIAIEPNAWQSLGRGLGAGESEFWVAELPSWSNVRLAMALMPNRIAVECDGDPIELAPSYGAAREAEGAVVYVDSPEVMLLDSDIMWSNKRFKSNLHWRYERSGVVLVARAFSKYNTPFPPDVSNFIRISAKLDGEQEQNFRLNVWKNIDSENENLDFMFEAAPGMHDLDLAVRGCIISSKRKIGKHAHLDRLIIGPSGNKLFYRQPPGESAPTEISPIRLKIPKLGSLTGEAIGAAAVEASNYGVGYTIAGEGTFPATFTLGGNAFECRRSALLVAPVEVKSKVSVGRNSILELKFAFLEGLAPTTPIALICKAYPPGSDDVLLEQKFVLEEADAGLWYSWEIELGELGEREVTIGLSLSGLVGESFAAILGEPVIVDHGDHGGEKPNVILVSLDTLRADHLGCYGYARDTSPAIDKIASEGVLFSRAFSNSCWTTNSHHSMLSGYYPLLFSHLSQSYDMPRFNRSIPVFATHMKEAGYRTVAFVGGGSVRPEYGFHQDFDFYSFVKGPWKEITLAGGEPRIVSLIDWAKAFEWLEGNSKSSPFFMFLHTYAIHAPYSAPPAYDELFGAESGSDLPPDISVDVVKEMQRVRIAGGEVNEADLEHVIKSYDRGIRYVDDEVAKLVALLSSEGVLDNTILVITSDHGEQFFEHGYAFHNHLYDEVLHVPLIIRFPKLIASGRRVEAEVESTDITPTLLDLVSIESKLDFHGESLRPAMAGKKMREGRSLFAVFKPKQAIRMNGLKYFVRNRPFDLKVIHGKDPIPEEELIDLQEDPGERNNLLASDGFDRNRFKPILRRMLLSNAACMPGLNLIFDPKDGTGKIVARLEDYEIERDVVSMKANLHSRDLDNLKIFIGRNRVSIEDFPALISFGPNTKGNFKLILRGFSGDEGGGTPLDMINLAGIKGQYASSPVAIEDFAPLLSRMRPYAGIQDDILCRYNAILFYVDVGAGDLRALKVGEEMNNELRDLGYIQ